MKLAKRIGHIRSSAIRDVGKKIAAIENCISFAAGLPDPSLFPSTELRAITDYLLSEKSHLALQYGMTKGYEPLVIKIVDGLKRRHHVDCHRSNIQVTTGSQQGISFVGITLLDPGDVVLALDGSLKAEHGTGRAVAPFVRREWGEDLYQIMQGLKMVIDPEGLLNPNVILNDNPNCHLENLKYAGPVDCTIDMCVDCGFCEYVCPSGGVGLTSWQRIYTLRAIAGLIRAGEAEKANRWQQQFREKLNSWANY
jgi:ferredoxin